MPSRLAPQQYNRQADIREKTMKNLYAAVCLVAMILVMAGTAAAEPRAIPAAALYDAFTKNGDEAKQKYLHKRIATEGVVHKTGNAGGNPEIIIHAAKDGSGTVVCQFPPSAANDIARMAKELHVVVIGTVSSFDAGTLRLTDCIFGQPRRR